MNACILKKFDTRLGPRTMVYECMYTLPHPLYRPLYGVFFDLFGLYPQYGVYHDLIRSLLLGLFY